MFIMVDASFLAGIVREEHASFASGQQYTTK